MSGCWSTFFVELFWVLINLGLNCVSSWTGPLQVDRNRALPTSQENQEILVRQLQVLISSIFETVTGQWKVIV
jgi:hypothetical protein